jgi:hypothetical protein
VYLLRMRESGLAEISSLEQHGDVLQVLSDGVKVGVIVRLLH